ncbi:MAG: cohesin domain-containing protein [Deltaproteobacteria bacterium]|nr:cohesin domain-containing protein [Deltaproteobacteria bacterium]
MTERARKVLVLLASAALVACMTGCYHVEDKSADAGGAFGFEAEGPGKAGDVWLELESESPAARTFTLKVLASGLKQVYGAAGRLVFDTKVCALRSAAPGDALEGGKAQVIAKGGPNAEGGVFGISRSGDFETSVDLGSGAVVGTLTFEIVGSGTTDIAFVPERSHAVTHTLESVAVAHWLGGTLNAP